MSTPLPPTNPAIPPYVPPWSAVPSVTPFTYRDGVTFLEKFDNLIQYINGTVIPFVNSSTSDLADTLAQEIQTMIDTVNQALADQDTEVDQKIADLTTYVNNAVDSIINNSITAQDPVVAGIMNDPASETRGVTDGLYAIAKDYYTKPEIDSEFADTNGNVSLNTASIANINTTLNGRLSAASLDARYVLKEVNAHAIIIGSSNAQPGYNWTTTLCNKYGWVEHNYAVGGGGYSVPGNQFIAQLTAAINDNSYDHSLVKYIWIIDYSNDCRGGLSIYSDADALFRSARTNYPNAQIIVLPVIWTYVTDNRTVIDRILGVTQRYNEVLNAGWAYDVKVIPNTWLWFWDSGNWADAPNGYHLNTTAQAKIIWFIDKWIKGQPINDVLGWQNLTPIISTANAVVWPLRNTRKNGDVTVIGRLQTVTLVSPDTDLGTVQPGCEPIDTVLAPMVSQNRDVTGAVYIYPNGIVRAMTTLQPNYYYWLITNYAAF
jgi:hypothetical protein